MNEHARKDLENIREWLQKQPHLPQKIDDNLLWRFLHCSNNSIEKAKYLIDLYFTIRSQAPEIFDNRDPNQPEIKAVIQNIDFLPLPKLRENKYRLSLNRIRSNDPELYDFVASVKAFFIFGDVRMVVEEAIPDGDIPIFDMKNFTLKHITKVVLPVLRKYMLYSQEAHPITLKEIHVLNVPSFLDRFMILVRPFLKSEVAKMLHFHLPNSDTLYEYIPKELLPNEYGGSVGSCDDIKKVWCDHVMNNRDYLIDETRWKLDEFKRLERNEEGAKQLFGTVGSFRSLSID